MEPGTKMTCREIMQILPHRYPFLFVDRVDDVLPPTGEKGDVGKKLIAYKLVTANEPFFQGHFPDNPIMPGVIIIEAMAQVCALCGYKREIHGDKLGILMMAINNARFRKPIVPGDEVRIESTMLKDKKTVYVFKCECYVRDVLVAEAEFMAQITDRKHLKMKRD